MLYSLREASPEPGVAEPLLPKQVDACQGCEASAGPLTGRHCEVEKGIGRGLGEASLEEAEQHSSSEYRLFGMIFAICINDAKIIKVL